MKYYQKETNASRQNLNTGLGNITTCGLTVLNLQDYNLF